MAIGSTAAWNVRIAGDNSNGGGFDSTISGAGTDYTYQDAAQLSLTDLATPGAGSTTLTSATGGFTAAMVGNCIRIASGANFTPGYYFITAYIDFNTVTVDRIPTPSAAGSGGVGKLGGAFATIHGAFATGGSISAAAVASPLYPGNRIYLQGSTAAPTTPDYAAPGGYFSATPGNTNDGLMTVTGYDGRPMVATDGMWLYSTSLWRFNGIGFKVAGSGFPSLGIVGSCEVHDVWVDVAGYDMIGVAGALIATSCHFYNSGSTAAGTASYAAIVMAEYGSIVRDCYINGWRGRGITLSHGSQVVASLIRACGQGGVYAGSVITQISLLRNIACSNAGAAIELAAASSISLATIDENILHLNTGAGIKCSVGSAATNDRLNGGKHNRNYFYANGSEVFNISNGSNDVTLTGSPFVDYANEDYNLNNTAGAGAAVRSTGFVAIGGVATSYADGGPFQHQDAGGSGGGLITQRGPNGGFA